MTGPNSEVGQKLVDLIKLGLEDRLTGIINLTVYDVANDDVTSKSMQSLIAKKTDIALGPLYSNTAKEIAGLLRAYGVTMITLSNNPLLADDGVFVFGHAPMKQTQRLFGYLLHKKFHDYIFLLPANKTSHNLAKILEDMVRTNNGNVIATELYADQPESIDRVIKDIADKVDELNENPNSNTKPVIYLADDSKIISNLFGSIKKYKLDKKAVICGDGRIDVDFAQPITTIYTGSLNVYNSNVGAWVTDNYGQEHMNNIETMAYDLGAIVSAAIGRSYDKEVFLSRLQSSVWHNGISGKIRFKNFIAERSYDIVKRDGTGYVTLDQAVTTDREEE